jgi:hypothetical protein
MLEVLFEDQTVGGVVINDQDSHGARFF